MIYDYSKANRSRGRIKCEESYRSVIKGNGEAPKKGSDPTMAARGLSLIEVMS